MTTIRFKVRGLVPQAKGSKRAYVVRRKGATGEGSKAYRAVLVEGGGSGRDGNAAPADARRKAWAEAMFAAGGSAMFDLGPLDGALALVVTFWFPRPKHETKAERLRIWHTTKPDSDKLDRALRDPMVKAGVIADDARIARAVIEKRYAPYGSPEQVGVDVEVSTMLETE